jgi:Ca2+-binding RTX toxin-like protein
LGSSGPDTIFDGGGSDVLTGRGGADVFLMDTDGRLDRITDFQPGLDRIDLSLIEGVYDPADLTMTMTATGLRIEYGSETLIVENAAGGPIDPATLDRADLFGLDRPPLALSGDSITGGSGNDILEGGLGGDVIDGGGGDDTVDGGFGNDWIEGADGQDSLSGGDGRDIISGGSGADLVDGGNGADLLFGGAEEDTLAGGAGDDLLLGGAGDDVLSGGSGQDTLRGGDGADLLDGGDGSDRLDGGPGDDSLTGGADADIFVMRPGGGSDTITDLEEGDLIDLLLMRLEMNADEMLDGHAHQVEADVVIDFGEESLTLTGVDLADLGADDFLL